MKYTERKDKGKGGRKQPIGKLEVQLIRDMAESSSKVKVNLRESNYWEQTDNKKAGSNCQSNR